MAPPAVPCADATTSSASRAVPGDRARGAAIPLDAAGDAVAGVARASSAVDPDGASACGTKSKASLRSSGSSCDVDLSSEADSDMCYHDLCVGLAEDYEEEETGAAMGPAASAAARDTIPETGPVFVTDHRGHRR